MVFAGWFSGVAAMRTAAFALPTRSARTVTTDFPKNTPPQKTRVSGPEVFSGDLPQTTGSRRNFPVAFTEELQVHHRAHLCAHRLGLGAAGGLGAGSRPRGARELREVG